jgi:hypothetical protein
MRIFMTRDELSKMTRCEVSNVYSSMSEYEQKIVRDISVKKKMVLSEVVKAYYFQIKKYCAENSIAK